MPLTYVLAANAGVVAAAVAAAVAARPTKRRRVASDMSTQPAVAIIAAKRVRRIMLQTSAACVLCTASQICKRFVAVSCQPLICNTFSKGQVCNGLLR